MDKIHNMLLQPNALLSFQNSFHLFSFFHFNFRHMSFVYFVATAAHIYRKTHFTPFFYKKKKQTNTLHSCGRIRATTGNTTWHSNKLKSKREKNETFE